MCATTLNHVLFSHLARPTLGGAKTGSFPLHLWTIYMRFERLNAHHHRQPQKKHNARDYTWDIGTHVGINTYRPQNRTRQLRTKQNEAQPAIHPAAAAAVCVRVYVASPASTQQPTHNPRSRPTFAWRICPTQSTGAATTTTTTTHDSGAIMACRTTRPA